MHYWDKKPRWVTSKQQCFLCGHELPNEEEVVRDLVMAEETSEGSELCEIDPVPVQVSSIHRGWEAEGNVAIIKLQAKEGEVDLTVSLDMGEVIRVRKQLQNIENGIEPYEDN